jgi:tetratricopeptide (TPR) repeat protein
LAIESRTLGPEHPYTLLTKSNLADALFEDGNVHEAEKVERETLASMARTLGPDHPGTLQDETTLARTLIREGRYAEAEKNAREAFDALNRTMGPQHPYTLGALQQLGTAMALDHRYAEASKLFRDVIEKQDNSKGQDNRFKVWYSFACVAVAGNHPDDALQYLQESLNHGYKDADGLMSDDDLKILYSNPKFQRLVAELKHPPTTIQIQ